MRIVYDGGSSLACATVRLCRQLLTKTPPSPLSGPGQDPGFLSLMLPVGHRISTDQ